MDRTQQGFSRERLARIDRFLEDRYIGAGRLPCAQLLVSRRGETAHQSVLGLRDVERGAALTEDTVFRIYSMTKPVTSVALMSLVEEGLIALDDPVARYIPAWADLGVFSAGVAGGFVTRRPARPMQVVDLMRHTSGLTYGFQYRSNVDAAYRQLQIDTVYGERDLEQMVGALAAVPLDFSPGEAWNYSVSTDVLGYIVQKVAAKPLDAVFQERVFDPLKMADTGFHVRDDQRGRFAACYEATPDGRMKLQDDPQTSPYLAPPPLLSGGGGLVSTAADYQRFCQMLLNGGELQGARILAPKTLRLMRANHLPGGGDLTRHSRSMFSESTYAGVGFGLGFAVVFDPPQALLPSSPGEFYWGGMASTAFWVDPVEEVTVVFMTQLMPSSATTIRRELRNLVYGALIEPNS
ncbi:MAG TPA: serine hydrolase domain-containing protein [Phenylobacterium sp.]|uniref:serine hydrolase domain-containing protein n=1 Tax=Phenylobacterium sp. TaxID=1871053 RepID=UPI002B473788|nr:serine hydrolase domain-containing protein [Phenylobacterium sp.]HKR88727.1 serine hydrolase domain-containing protein [Phenylobacterium sp.]